MVFNGFYELETNFVYFYKKTKEECCFVSLFNFSFPRPSLLSFRTFLPSFLTLPFQKGKVRKEGRKVVTVFLTLPFWKGKVRKEGRKVRKTEGRKVKQRHKAIFLTKLS